MEDAELLAVLAERTFREAFGAANKASDMDSYCSRALAPETLRGELADPDLSTWVAEENGRMIAYAQLAGSSPPSCVCDPGARELRRLYVDSSRHGRGLAQALMSLVKAHAAANGDGALWLGVWERNPRAIRFYEKSGFRIVGDQAFRLGADLQRDLIMVAPLAD